jgi:hypothetical protein
VAGQNGRRSLTAIAAAHLHEPSVSRCCPSTNQRCGCRRPQGQWKWHTTLALEQKGARSQPGRDLLLNDTSILSTDDKTDVRSSIQLEDLASAVVE